MWQNVALILSYVIEMKKKDCEYKGICLHKVDEDNHDACVHCDYNKNGVEPKEDMSFNADNKGKNY